METESNVIGDMVDKVVEDLINNCVRDENVDENRVLNASEEPAESRMTDEDLLGGNGVQDGGNNLAEQMDIGETPEIGSESEDMERSIRTFAVCPKCHHSITDDGCVANDATACISWCSHVYHRSCFDALTHVMVLGRPDAPKPCCCRNEGCFTVLAPDQCTDVFFESERLNDQYDVIAAENRRLRREIAEVREQCDTFEEIADRYRKTATELTATIAEMKRAMLELQIDKAEPATKDDLVKFAQNEATRDLVEPAFDVNRVAESTVTRIPNDLTIHAVQQVKTVETRIESTTRVVQEGHGETPKSPVPTPTLKLIPIRPMPQLSPRGIVYAQNDPRNPAHKSPNKMMPSLLRQTHEAESPESPAYEERISPPKQGKGRSRGLSAADRRDAGPSPAQAERARREAEKARAAGEEAVRREEERVRREARERERRQENLRRIERKRVAERDRQRQRQNQAEDGQMERSEREREAQRARDRQRERDEAEYEERRNERSRSDRREARDRDRRDSREDEVNVRRGRSLARRSPARRSPVRRSPPPSVRRRDQSRRRRSNSDERQDQRYRDRSDASAERHRPDCPRARNQPGRSALLRDQQQERDQPGRSALLQADQSHVNFSYRENTSEFSRDKYNNRIVDGLEYENDRDVRVSTSDFGVVWADFPINRFNIGNIIVRDGYYANWPIEHEVHTPNYEIFHVAGIVHLAWYRGDQILAFCNEHLLIGDGVVYGAVRDYARMTDGLLRQLDRYCWTLRYGIKIEDLIENLKTIDPVEFPKKIILACGNVNVEKTGDTATRASIKKLLLFLRDRGVTAIHAMPMATWTDCSEDRASLANFWEENARDHFPRLFAIQRAANHVISRCPPQHVNGQGIPFLREEQHLEISLFWLNPPPQDQNQPADQYDENQDEHRVREQDHDAERDRNEWS